MHLLSMTLAHSWPPVAFSHYTHPRIGVHMMKERPICFWLFRQAVRCALALAFANAGSNSAARMAMMAMTTSNSISVNALGGRMLFFIPMPLATQIWTPRVARHVHAIYLQA